MTYPGNGFIDLEEMTCLALFSSYLLTTRTTFWLILGSSMTTQQKHSLESSLFPLLPTLLLTAVTRLN
jgi:hypothetical protein